MRRVTLMFFLVLAASLGAIVNLGDEYIGSTPMGEFRKLSCYYSDFTDYNYYSIGGETFVSYYYNESVPTRVDSVHYHAPNASNQGLKMFYEYTDFDDYYQMTLSGYPWFVVNYQVPTVSGYYKYDSQDRLLEFCLPEGYYGGVNKAIYEYDANGNLILKKEYNVHEDADNPRDVTTYEYDAQNREIYSQTTQYQSVFQTTWNTWSDHSLPDSTHILYHPSHYVQETIILRHFDENEECNHSVVFYKYRPTSDDAEIVWERYDMQITYTLVDGMAFPNTRQRTYSYVSDPNDPYEPHRVLVTNFDYSNDYHSVNISIVGSTYTQECTYDDNWLLTNSTQSYGGEPYIRTITWEYYGPTSTDDPVAVTPAVLSAYPNPAKGVVNISLSKSSANTSAEAKVYNIKGQLVRRLEVSEKTSDQYLYNWDCKDRNNRAVPAGVYFIRIKTNSGEVNKKVTVIK
jgi:hypothetical protein